MSTGSKKSYLQYCGVARTLDLVGERWTLLLVRDLLLGPQRYSDLLDGLPGLTTNLLARRLKCLEEDGLVEKVKLPPPNPAKVYRLTELGRELEPLVLEACEWGNRFMAQPAPEEQQNLGWSLLRLKRRYKGNQNFVVELRAPERIFHIALRLNGIQVHQGGNPTAELIITGSTMALHQLFFGPTRASELIGQGEIVAQGEFGRWPRLMAAFGLA